MRRARHRSGPSSQDPSSSALGPQPDSAAALGRAPLGAAGLRDRARSARGFSTGVAGGTGGGVGKVIGGAAAGAGEAAAPWMTSSEDQGGSWWGGGEQAEEAPTSGDSPGLPGLGGGGPGLGNSGVATGSTPLVLPAQDELLDPYMDARWDRAEYDALVAQHGPPRSALNDPVQAMDRLLPAELSRGARSAIHLGAAFFFGALDHATFQALAPESVESAVDALSGLKGLHERFSFSRQHDAPLLAALQAGGAVAEGLLGYTNDAVGSLSSAVSQVDAVVRCVELASVEGAGLALGQTLAEDEVQVPMFALQAFMEGVLGSLDLVTAGVAQVEALEAEEAGHFATGEAFREVTRSEGLEALQRVVDLATAVVFEFCPGLDLVSSSVGAAKTLMVDPFVDLDLGASTGEGALAALELHLGTNAAATGLDAAAAVQAGALGVDLPVGITDPMKVDPDALDRDYVPRDGALGVQDGLLQAARQRTLDWLEADGAALSADPPAWSHALMEQLQGDGKDDLLAYASPSTWMARAISLAPGLAVHLGTESLLASAGALEGLASALGSGPLQSLQADMDALMASLKPELEEALGEVDTLAQQQQVRLTGLREAASLTREHLGSLKVFGGLEGIAEQSLAPLRASLEAMRLDPAALTSGPLVPLGLVAELVTPLNQSLDALLAQVDAAIMGTVGTLQAQLDSLLEAFELKLARFEEAIADGGSLERELQQHADWLKARLHQLVEAFTAWDGEVDLDPAAAALALRTMAIVLKEAPPAREPARPDPWPVLLREVILPEYLAWQARHRVQVASQYHPEVPIWELAAAEQVVQQARARGLSPEHEARVMEALGRCANFAGRRGRNALVDFWQAEEALLVELVNSANT